MVTQDEINTKWSQINAARVVEQECGFDAFTCGQLAGAQQVLWWMYGCGMEPMRAILDDAQLEIIRGFCACGMGDGSLPELHDEYCPVHWAAADQKVKGGDVIFGEGA